MVLPMHSALTATLFLRTPSHSLLSFTLNHSTPLSPCHPYPLIFRFVCCATLAFPVQKNGWKGNGIEPKTDMQQSRVGKLSSQQTHLVQRDTPLRPYASLS